LLPQTTQVRSLRLNLNPQRRQANDFSSNAKQEARAFYQAARMYPTTFLLRQCV
jgi:hypothetical protein